MPLRRDDGWQHPDWCSPGLCERLGSNLFHRQVPEVLTPRGDPARPPDPQRPTVTWELERDDEVDTHGRQVVGETRIVVDTDGARVRLATTEAAVFGAAIVAKAVEGRHDERAGRCGPFTVPGQRTAARVFAAVDNNALFAFYHQPLED